ncbi:MAG: HIT family protein [Bacteroides sp.]
MASIFTKIIHGEIPCYELARDEHFISFLDISPIQRGHALVVPLQEVDYIFDLPQDILTAMLPFAQRVARAIETVVPCKRIGLAVVGIEVPHAHMHLVPLQEVGSLDFGLPRLSLSPAEYQELAAAIRSKIV